MSNLRKCKVSIFGESYVIVTDESDEHINTVAQLVNNSMKEIADKAQIEDTKRIAVLVALQLASKFLSTNYVLNSYESTSQKLVNTFSLLEKELN